jgi:small-conductance mechanosensitive channel
MILFIECVIACAVFTIIILPSLYKEPIKHIMSYPKEIRERVENLPQYKDMIQAQEKRHLSIKLIAVLIFAIVLAVVAYFSGAKSFTSAYLHVFILIFVVNIYDMIVLDVGIFCHSKRTRIPGTEDMDKEYRDPWHHIRGAVIGTIIGAVVALLSGGIVHIISLL